MKYLDNLTALIGKPVSANDFEVYHQLKLLKIEVAKLENELLRSKDEKDLTESLLKSTIEDLKVSNQKIRKLRRQELDASEKELKFKDSQLSQITQSMTSSMCYIDQHYKYRYVNHKYQEWFGLGIEDVEGKTLNDFAPEKFKMLRPVYDKVMEGEKFDFEIDTIIPSGKRMVFLNTYVPAYDLDGKNIGLYLYCTDVTANKLANESLEATKKEITKKNKTLKQYIESNVQLEQFAHIAAHDMRAPLRTISSFTGILEKKIAADIAEGEREYFKYIKEGTQSLSEMITDLLDYSKVKSQGLCISEFDCDMLVAKVLKYLDNSICEQKAKVIVGSLPSRMNADRKKMYQVLQNLISNGMKFHQNGVSPVVKLEAAETEDAYVFTVSDNGMGIPEENRDEVFDAFKQLNTKHKFKGTGLGLAICKRIVDDHGGDISCAESDMGGAQFKFTIKKDLA